MSASDIDAPPLHGYNGLPLPVVGAPTLMAIARRHGLHDLPVRRQPWAGAMNTVYELGPDLMLRVPLNIPQATRCILEEAVVLPLLEHHDIRAPRLVVADESCELIEVPYTIYQRLHGQSMDWWETTHDPSPELYRAIGRQLATIHERVLAFPVDEARLTSPRRYEPDEILAIARLPHDARRWIEATFERLRRALDDQSVRPRFLHADVRPGNTIVADGALVGLIDWGSAGWGDAALEFSALWLWAVPHALAGYREVMPLDGDATGAAEARIVWDHLVRVLLLEGAIDVLRGIDWVLSATDGAPVWIRKWLAPR